MLKKTEEEQQDFGLFGKDGGIRPPVTSASGRVRQVEAVDTVSSSTQVEGVDYDDITVG